MERVKIGERGDKKDGKREEGEGEDKRKKVKMERMEGIKIE